VAYNHQQIIDRLVAKTFTRFPFLVRKWAKTAKVIEFDSIPWTSVEIKTKDLRLALVSTAGVHLKTQKPFDMDDRMGDPTFREIPWNVRKEDVMITHNYYDHTDADRDVNLVLPIELVRELVQVGEINSVAKNHYSFMGHILGEHVKELMHQTAPEVMRRLQADGVNAVFLTPA